jgi:coenzyme Q-binding protein COQ10
VHGVPFTAKQMFDLVADVERYPEFVPYCNKLIVHSREVRGSITRLIATMSVGYSAIRESFTTRVTLDPTQQRILVEYLDGPFSHLENRWSFTPASGGCTVDFHIEYEFRSRLLAMALGTVFGKAFQHFAKVFEERARKVYAKKAEELS